jgi:hypothetical protein
LAGLALVSNLRVNVMISQDVLSEFAKDLLESNLGQQTGNYLDRLSAAVLPALVRGDPRELVDALDRAQGDRSAGVEPRFVILALPDGTILASSDARRFPVQSVVPDDLRTRFPHNGIRTELGTDHAWLVRTLRTNYGFRVGRLFAEVDIPGLERGRRDERSGLRWSWVIGCLMTMTPLVPLGGYFVVKRMLRKGIDLFQFFVYLGVGFLVISVASLGWAPLLAFFAAKSGLLGVLFLLLGISLRKGMVPEGPRHGTAGRIAELACWTVIGLLLSASFNNLFQPLSSRGPRSIPAYYPAYYPEDYKAIKAIGLFKQADYPAVEEALKLGETYYARGNYAEAVAAFDTAASNAGAFNAPGTMAPYPTEIIAPEALLKVGMSLARANQKQDACWALAIVLGEFDDVFAYAIAGNTSAGNAIKELAEDEKKKLGC